MPLVQVHQDVPEVLVALPVGLLPVDLAAEVERNRSFVPAHRVAQRAQFLEPFRCEVNQFIPGGWSRHDIHTLSQVFSAMGQWWALQRICSSRPVSTSYMNPPTSARFLIRGWASTAETSCFKRLIWSGLAPKLSHVASMPLRSAID